MRSIVLALLAALLVTGCIVRSIVGSHATGTCAGACDHYVECKPGHSDVDLTRCQKECPDVFADHDSLAAYENLRCEDAVSYVDGDPRAHAKR